MKLFRFLNSVCVLVCLLTNILFAQDRLKTNVAVLDLKSKDISSSASLSLSNIVRKELIGIGNFNVVDRGNMEEKF